MSLMGTIQNLSEEISYCEGYEEALGILNCISVEINASPIVLGYWYLWPPELYCAYMDAMRRYVWKCLHG